MMKPPVFRAIVSRLDKIPLVHSRYDKPAPSQDVRFRKHLNKLFKVKR